jgi:autotransporter-associated beta strand protein
VYGGYSAVSGNATGHTITIGGSPAITGNIYVTGNIYGGYSDNGGATENKVTIGGTSTIITGDVYGGYSASDAGDLFSKNYLTKNSKESEIRGTVSNFQRLTFTYSGEANIGGLDTTVRGNNATAVEINIEDPKASNVIHNVIFDGEITGRGGLNKTGDGTLTLARNNTYEGNTTITGGLIEFSDENNFGSGNITLNGGGLQWAACGGG